MNAQTVWSIISGSSGATVLSGSPILFFRKRSKTRLLEINEFRILLEIIIIDKRGL